MRLCNEVGTYMYQAVSAYDRATAAIDLYARSPIAVIVIRRSLFCFYNVYLSTFLLHLPPETDR